MNCLTPAALQAERRGTLDARLCSGSRHRVPPSDRIDTRIALLEEFLTLLQKYQDLRDRLTAPHYGRVIPPNEERDEFPNLRSQINRKLFAARQAVLQSGAMKVVTYADHPNIGGRQTNYD